MLEKKVQLERKVRIVKDAQSGGKEFDFCGNLFIILNVNSKSSPPFICGDNFNRSFIEIVYF